MRSSIQVLCFFITQQTDSDSQTLLLIAFVLFFLLIFSSWIHAVEYADSCRLLRARYNLLYKLYILVYM